MPEAELGVRPAEKPSHDLSFYCQDVEATREEQRMAAEAARQEADIMQQMREISAEEDDVVVSGSQVGAIVGMGSSAIGSAAAAYEAELEEARKVLDSSVAGGKLGQLAAFKRQQQTLMTTVSEKQDATPFVINAGLNDAWYDPDTDGQGFFITVFPDLNFVSLAWFTYDTELPPDDATANLGDPGHRWMTAGGTIDGNQAVMDITITRGGLFDTATETQGTEPPGSDGTITLTFEDCSAGLVEYDITSIDQQGTVPIQRIVDDNISLCEALITGE